MVRVLAVKLVSLALMVAVNASPTAKMPDVGVNVILLTLAVFASTPGL